MITITEFSYSSSKPYMNYSAHGLLGEQRIRATSSRMSGRSREQESPQSPTGVTGVRDCLLHASEAFYALSSLTQKGCPRCGPGFTSCARGHVHLRYQARPSWHSRQPGFPLCSVCDRSSPLSSVLDPLGMRRPEM